MGKILTLTFSLLFSAVAYASMSAQEVVTAVKGRYSATFDGQNYSFLLRSSGDVNLLTQGGYVSEAEFLLAYSGNSIGPDGLPVVHLTFLEGSDEESRDFHILLTVEKDFNEYEVKFIHAFTTFNDGPNDYSSFEGSFDPKLKKYNTKTKKYESLK
jgi:hypothetical protein